MRSSDMHDVDMAFSSKKQGVQLVEEVFHGKAVARIEELVPVEVGERKTGDAALQGTLGVGKAD